jgi:hypothetical protein
MNLFQVDDDGRLFIAAAIENWESLARCNIDNDRVAEFIGSHAARDAVLR